MAEKLTGKELLDRLAATGTGDAKLAAAREIVRQSPDVGALEIVESLRRLGAGEGTMRKCEDVLGVKLLAREGEAARPLFPVRAPVGGCKVGGRQFQAGEVVPDEFLTRATPEEYLTLGKPTVALEIQPVNPAGTTRAVAPVPTPSPPPSVGPTKAAGLSPPAREEQGKAGAPPHDSGSNLQDKDDDDPKGGKAGHAKHK